MNAIARLALLGCLLLGAAAQAQVLNLLATSPLSHFTDADNKVFMATIDKALASGTDGVPMAWKGDGTPAAGVVTPQKSYESGGMKCRDLLIVSSYKTLKAEAEHTFCKNSAGEWKIRQ